MFWLFHWIYDNDRVEFIAKHYKHMQYEIVYCLRIKNTSPSAQVAMKHDRSKGKFWIWYFKGRKFRGVKLSRTPMVKIKSRGYKLSRTSQILVKFSYFDTIFSDFSCNISRTPMKVRFCGYKLSRTPKKLAKSRKFLPAELSTFKVIKNRNC